MNRLFGFLCLVLLGLPVQINCQDRDNDLEKPGTSNLINDWITVHLRVIRNGKVFNHNHRQSSYIGIALYESIVNGDKRYRSLNGQLNGYKSPVGSSDTAGVCWKASANSALAAMFRYFYHEQSDLSRFDSVENAWRKQLLSEGNSESSVLTGSKYGQSVAKSVIAWCETDGSDKADAEYDVPKGPGFWEPTPPRFAKPITPYMGNERTIVEGSIDNSLPPPPETFSENSESAYYKMVSEVYDVSRKLDSEKKGIGLFWDDFPDGKSVTSGGHGIR